jgi:CheY-like chemotaxis protein
MLRSMSEQFRSASVVLILEDEAIIALNLQDELQDAGYSVGGPFATCTDALSWLETNTPDVAILDTVLKDAPCGEVARELASRTVSKVRRGCQEGARRMVGARWPACANPRARGIWFDVASPRGPDADQGRRCGAVDPEGLRCRIEAPLVETRLVPEYSGKPRGLARQA